MSFFRSDRCLLIAEVAQTHDGSLGLAHAFIDAIAAAGADAVKFQTHIAAAESSRSEPWRAPFSSQDPDRYSYWRRMEFSEDQWAGLAAHARERRLLFLSSPFSLEAAEMLGRVGVPAWKVASGEVDNVPLLDHLLSSGLPLMVSTGMSPMKEVDALVHRLRASGADLCLMQSTSVYPCPAEKVGIDVIPTWRARYGISIGLSDHSGTVYPGLAAATFGIEALEVHVTLSRAMFGPDVSSSVTADELRVLVEGVRFIERMRAHPSDKDAVAEELHPVREIFARSVIALSDLEPGATLTRSTIGVRKPGGGVPPERFAELIGRRVRRSVRAGQQLSDDDLGPILP